MAYKLTFSSICNIHPICHVSQLRKAEGNLQLVIDIPSHLNEELEMVVD